MEELMEEFSITEFTKRRSVNGEARTGLRTGSSGLWIVRGQKESEEKLFKLRIYPDGDRPRNEGYVSILFDLYSYDTMPFKVTMLESAIVKEDFVLSFSFFECTVSVVNFRGELRFSQTFALDLKGRTIKSYFPVELDRLVRVTALLESREELLPGDRLTLRCEVVCVHCTIQNDRHRENALQTFYLRKMAKEESWFIGGEESEDGYWLLDLRNVDSPLCAKLREQSYFFDGLFRSPCKEMEDGFLAIHKSDYAAFFNMLGYVRFGTLHHVKWDSEYSDLYGMANMYGMSELQEICGAHAKQHLGRENAFNMLRIADLCNDEDLRTLEFRQVLSDWKGDWLYGKHWIMQNWNRLRPELANELLCATEVLDLDKASRLCALAARQVLLNLEIVEHSPVWSIFEKKLPDLAKLIRFYDSGLYLPAEKYKTHALEYDFYR